MKHEDKQILLAGQFDITLESANAFIILSHFDFLASNNSKRQSTVELLLMLSKIIPGTLRGKIQKLKGFTIFKYIPD